MPRALSLGNGTVLANLDQRGFLGDLYYPYVGHENHIGGDFAHKVGVFADGRLSWLSDGDWRVKVTMAEDSLVGTVEAENDSLRVKLVFTDACYNEKNIFLRKVVIKNLAENERPLKIFFTHQFELAESHTAHTAYYDTEAKAVVHYRNHRAFLANAQLEGRPFDDWSMGVFKSEGKEGTYRDAEDGELAKNPIEHGQADSGIGLSAVYRPAEEKHLAYWLAIGESVEEVRELNDYVLQKGLSHLVETTANYWKAWTRRYDFKFEGLAPEVVRLFRQSVLYIRAHTDKGGGVIASGDSTMLQKGKDTYAYVWPRDGAFASLALTGAGDFTVARRFFEFCDRTIGKEGYFFHKYSPDGALGSSWHSWLGEGKPQLPIQEDETAIVLYSLRHYYEHSKDLEFIESVYNTLIKPAADFLVLFRDEATGLPNESFDLWEEKYGVHTYTVASAYGALMAAADFAGMLGKVKNEHLYRTAAEEVKKALFTYLYDEATGLFRKSVALVDGEIIPDDTVDMSSVYGVFLFKVLPPEDKRLRVAMEKSVVQCASRNMTGGIGRYAGDPFYRGREEGNCNPWFVTTLWFAQYTIAHASNQADLRSAIDWLSWAARYASSAGALSEQLNAVTGEPLSAGPLVWSHAEYVRTVIMYLDKLEVFGVCFDANPVY
ncbi:MAG TPA: glycoside hydrolase family 15 protein [Candidatus Paceibacterota bacterium]|nr:glycoside hydrolase family 15 protein [Candidatus Paceibacterota bacterium]